MSTATTAEMYADFERTGTLAPMYARALFSHLSTIEAENAAMHDVATDLSTERDMLESENTRLRLIEEAARFEAECRGCAPGIAEGVGKGHSSLSQLHEEAVFRLRAALTKKEEG